MTLKPAKHLATYQDVIDAPFNMRAELIEGDLYLQPKPRGVHQLVAGRIFERLGPVRNTGGWVILPDVELHIPMTLAPDLSGWLAHNFTEPLDSAYFQTVPDWVCEILSPSTKSYDLGLKRRIYLESGVEWLWIVDPAERTLEIFEAKTDSSRWELLGTWDEKDVLGKAHPFALELDLTTLWDL